MFKNKFVSFLKALHIIWNYVYVWFWLCFFCCVHG